MKKKYSRKNRIHVSAVIENRRGRHRVPLRLNRTRTHHNYPRPTSFVERESFEISEKIFESVQDTGPKNTQNVKQNIFAKWMYQAQKLVSNWNFAKLHYLYLFIGIVCLSVIGLIFINRFTVTDTINGGTVASSSEPSEPLESDEEAVVVDVKPVFKSQEAKDLVVQEDLEYMSSLGLYYDYANLSLEDTVNAFLIEQGLSPSQVAFTYKNLVTNEVFSMNDSQLMTAGSTYKLPLNMLVVDAVEEGEVSATESYDITGLTYEYKPEHDAYVENYNGKMTIADMQYGSIVVSENTPAYALAERVGGMDQAYSNFNRYGVSNNLEVPTFSISDNKTTTSYYTHVLDYLYQHQDKYADLLYYLDLAFPGLWLEQYVHGVTIYQKPGYVREALNIDAIVMEETPYSIALYTSYFGNASEDDIEIDAVGYNQVTALAYVIHEWHRVNMNPASEMVE